MNENKLWKVKYNYWYQGRGPEISENFVVTVGDSLSDIVNALYLNGAFGQKFQILEAQYLGDVILGSEVKALDVPDAYSRVSDECGLEGILCEQN